VKTLRFGSQIKDFTSTTREEEKHRGLEETSGSKGNKITGVFLPEKTKKKHIKTIKQLHNPKRVRRQKPPSNLVRGEQNSLP
jgi:hypothetical protein